VGGLSHERGIVVANDGQGISQVSLDSLISETRIVPTFSPRDPALVSQLPGLGVEPLERPSLVQRIGYSLLNPPKNRIVPSPWLRALMRRSGSALIAESFVSPGGWRSMEILYRNPQPLDWLDRQALRDNPITMAARNRRKIVIDRLADLIRQHPADEPMSLLGIGAGPGRHLQTAMLESGRSKDLLTAYLVDLADDAFPYGQALAKSLGLDDRVHFLRGDARNIGQTLPQTQIHLAKLVGIIEYLTDEQLAELLTAVHGILAPGGHLLTHGLVDRYKTGRFLARVFNLRHHQRDERALEKSLTAAGFRIVSCEYEPVRIHPIVTAVRVGV